jgi:hypothetical protein
MPWAVSGDEMVSGTSQYGAATLALGLVSAALLGAPYLKGTETVPFRLAALGALLCGVLAAIAVSYDIADISRVVRLRGEHLGASPAFGLYVTLAGAVLLALGSLTTALAKPRAS